MMGKEQQNQPLTPEEERQLRRMARQLIDAAMKTLGLKCDAPTKAAEEGDGDTRAQAA